MLTQELQPTTDMQDDASHLLGESATILEAMSHGVIVFDIALDIVCLNSAGQQLLGISHEFQHLSPSARAAALQLHLCDGQAVALPMLPASRAVRGECVRNAVYSIIRPDTQERRWLSVNAAPSRALDGAVCGAVVTFTDITVFQHEDILSTFAHDFRNPLAIIHWYSGLISDLLTQPDSLEAIHDAVAVISRNIDRMVRMVEDLEEDASLTRGLNDLTLSPVVLQTYLPQFLSMVKYGVAVERVICAIPPDLPPVSADSTRLERILLNLLSNALKYSSNGTPVTINARSQYDEVIISIVDHGPGILPEDRPHLFERYYRAKSHQCIAGKGLGLFIVKQLVDAHGGSAWVEPTTEQGSTFAFSLKVATG